MRIGELAEQVGVNPKTVRYYEDIGVLPEPERTPSGYRVYDEADVDRLVFVKTAQRLGMTLDEVKEILALRDRGEQPCSYVRDVLRRERAHIDQRITELQALRSELATLEELTNGPEVSGVVCKIIEHVREKTAPGEAG